MSNTKIIRINDYVSIYYRGSNINCPISRMTVTEYDLGMIMNRHDTKPPKHIYAICPKDRNVLVPLTKENFKLTNEELFPEYYATETPVAVEKEERHEFEKKSFNEMVKETTPAVEETVTEAPIAIEEVKDEVVETPVTETVEEVVVEETKVAEVQTEESKDDEEVIVVAGASVSDEDTTEEDVIEVVSTTVEETKTETTTAAKTNNNNYNKNKKKKHK